MYECRAVELRHLRYFVAVAEELHFGRAARRLRIAQPPLSQQIRRLEQDLGATLFLRTKRRVELTAAGQAFLPEARSVLTQAERAVHVAQRAGQGEGGRLVVGFVPSAGLDLLPRVLTAARVRLPHFEIDPRALYPEQQVDALRAGQIQVGLLRLPIDDDGLAVEPILREPLVVALPQGHRLARRKRVRVADLADDSIILFPRRIAPAYHDSFVVLCRQSGFTPRMLLASGSIQTNLGLVAAGLGVTLLPASVRALKRTGVVYRSLAPPGAHVEMAMAYASDDASTVLPTFLQVVRDAAAASS